MERTLGTVAVVVAHPDDEALWGLPPKGATIFVCSTPRFDMARVEQFEESCKILGARGVVHTQAGRRFIGTGYPLALDEFLKPLRVYETVITHNARGEYNHPEHIQVHDWVLKHFRGKILQYGYGMGGVEKMLTDEELDRKIRAIKCYHTEMPGKPGAPTWQRFLEAWYDGKEENLRREQWIG